MLRSSWLVMCSPIPRRWRKKVSFNLAFPRAKRHPVCRRWHSPNLIGRCILKSHFPFLCAGNPIYGFLIWKLIRTSSTIIVPLFRRKVLPFRGMEGSVPVFHCCTPIHATPGGGKSGSNVIMWGNCPASLCRLSGMSRAMSPSAGEFGILTSRLALIVIVIWQTTMMQIAKAILFPFAAIVFGLVELSGVHKESLNETTDLIGNN